VTFDPRRTLQARALARKVVIACEGRKTEPSYFHDIRTHLRASTIDIVLVPHQGTDPATLVAAADDKRAELKRARRWSPGDTAWAVFDGEEHQDTDGKRQRWNDAVRVAIRHGGFSPLGPRAPCPGAAHRMRG
jgi:hypothetical protein